MRRLFACVLPCFLACGPLPVDADDAGLPDAGLARDDAGAHELDAGQPADDAGTPHDDAGQPEEDAGAVDEDAGTGGEDAGAPPTDAGAPPVPCVTRITYGAAWIHAASHTTDFDEVNGVVTWDGSCGLDANGNSFATLSNGWKPYFTGRGGCVIALDQRGDCPVAAGACRTRVGYGATWLPAPNHPDAFDDVSGRVTWDGVCRASGSNAAAQLSNGWTPTFSGANHCDLSLRYQQCGGLYANPVLGQSCPDPGVMKAGNTYYMACTSGNAANAYPLRKSTDLVHWTSIGAVMPQANKPAWATGDFWAPELHQVGTQYVAYFSARHTNGIFAIGAAVSPVPQGPYQAQPQPLLQTGSPGVIDVHFFEAPNGDRFLLWKPDSNALGQHPVIKLRKLAADGLSFNGAETTILQNDSSWEGLVIEGPWMIYANGWYYLFYSGNGYASTHYGIGVARASSPTGPFTKSPDNPILVTRGAWAGPGHGSVLKGPSGDWVHVYHSWEAGHVGESPPGREVLVDRVTFRNGWPEMLAAPSSGSQPLP